MPLKHYSKTFHHFYNSNPHREQIFLVKELQFLITDLRGPHAVSEEHDLGVEGGHIASNWCYYRCPHKLCEETNLTVLFYVVLEYKLDHI